MLQYDRLLTIYLFRFLTGILRASKNISIPVLMYHSVSEQNESSTAPFYRLSIRPKLFERHMSFLKENGYKSLNAFELFDAINRRRSFDKNISPVAITFDDGFKDFLSNAYPILNKYNQTATVYLPTGFIKNDTNHFNGREVLTWSEIRTLHKKNISFGSHTANHLKLYGQTWRTIRKELAQSKHTLENELECEIPWFSYPYAFPSEDSTFVSKFSEELIKFGYQTCVTTSIGRAHIGSNQYTIRRLHVNDCDDIQLFSAKLSGHYDWMRVPQVFKKKYKSLKRFAR